MDLQPGMSYIYTLSDPVSGGVRYVGQSIDPEARLREHRCGGTAATSWSRLLEASGRYPHMEVIETVPTSGVYAAESRWITYYREAGADLLNRTSNAGGRPTELKEPALISVKLEAEDLASLRDLSARFGSPVSWLIRRGVSLVLAEAQRAGKL